MIRPLRSLLLSLVGTCLAAGTPDLAKDPTLYVVNYSHLDTEWRWSYPQVVREMLANTLNDNFRIMDAHPDYVFNWSGASRYQLFQEYYPEQFARLKGYAARGQWFPAGGSWEESDVNVPSSESVLRQLLVGRGFFLRELGRSSSEFMLPDCFGFPASLPSILHHAGYKGFSTQKLTWHSAEGIPFDVGRWTGPDGNAVIAALDAGDYAKEHRESFASPRWQKRLEKNGRVSGLKAGYVYNGTGDQGGAPHKVSMETLWKSMAEPGPVTIIAGPAETMFNTITAAQKAALPEYKGDLLLVEHSAGSITSQAFMKRLNRRNELLADAAEKASAAADLLGACAYPAGTLAKAWGLMLRNQFHDTLPGTSLPKVYEYAWNDGILAARTFEGALADAAGAVSRGLDTRTGGVALMVFNPLGVDRADVVEALVPEALAGAQELVASDGGRELPAQRVTGGDGLPRVIFRAEVPALSFKVFGLRAGTAAGAGLKAEGRTLENGRYRITVDAAGDLASVLDKGAGRELLAAPARLAFQSENPEEYPAWNMDWKDQAEQPRGFVTGPAGIRIVENGPVRVALQVTRESEGSRFQQCYRLSAGGDTVEVANVIDWKSSAACLKATFPLTVANPEATYSWDLGTVRRGNNNYKKFEVPSHGWLDLGDKAGGYGVTLLTGAKYGSDKPDDHTLRLTLLYTPGVHEDCMEQRWQDWGRHAFTYGIAGHAGDWRDAGSPWLALRQDQPLAAFEVPNHPGPLGACFTLLRPGSAQVAVQAVKQAEDGRGLVVRLQELQGRPGRGITLAGPGPITAAQELDGVERVLAELQPAAGALALDFGPYQLRTLRLSLSAPTQVPAAAATPLPLPFDLAAFSSNQHRDGGAMAGACYPAEMRTGPVRPGGLAFELGPAADGARNALACAGQTLALPAGTVRVHLLAAASEPGVSAAFSAGGRAIPVPVPFWSGRLGSWDNRRFEGAVPELAFNVPNPLLSVEPAFLNEGRPAWWASHVHAGGQDQVYSYGYIFEVTVAVPAGARTLTLPRDPRIKLFAATAAAVDNAGARALQPLFPDLVRDPSFRNRFDHP